MKPGNSVSGNALRPSAQFLMICLRFKGCDALSGMSKQSRRGAKFSNTKLVNFADIEHQIVVSALLLVAKQIMLFSWRSRRWGLANPGSNLRIHNGLRICRKLRFEKSIPSNFFPLWRISLQKCCVFENIPVKADYHLRNSLTDSPPPPFFW